jgi:hypothetical protein
MKKYIISAFAGLALMTSCVDLDLNPLSEGSSENWFSTEQEVTLALNALYNPDLWKTECNRYYNTDRWTDDWNQRTQLYDWVGGTIDSGWSQGNNEWNAHYKGIARANTILYSLDKAKESLTEEKIAQYAGEAKFFRASFYMYLIHAFGDVPFYTEYISLEQAYEMGRTDREVILQQIYKDYDDAAAVLPEVYTGTVRVTKGAALAMKARAALLMNDWATCAAAAKACMDLKVYSLHPDFEEFFHSKTKTSPELIFALPYSNELGLTTFNAATVKSFLPRNAGGTSVAQPSWELFFAFTCTDGKNVEDSPLYDPANPFANRDPRLAATTAEFDKEFLDYIYNPRPSAKKTIQVSTGTEVTNKDCKPGSKDCSYNGLVLKKAIDAEWTDDQLTDAPARIIRYADVLLMYAEAKMEMDQIDQTVFDALNSIRARAYKCGIAETTKYPAITETDQTELRRIIRNERRCELAWENRRWFDLIRWRLCEECLTLPVYGLPDNNQSTANEATGYWPFPKDFRPVMRPSSTIDITSIEQYEGWYTKNVAKRGFVPRQYLYPIPLNDRTVCYNLTQNPGY